MDAALQDADASVYLPAPQASLERSLQAFSETAAEYADGLSNHGPMTVEALFTLGRADAIADFTEGTLPGLPRSPVGAVMAGGDLAALIGDPEQFTVLRGIISREFAMELATENTVGSTTASWVGRLADSPIASAGHGLIRTFHAWRNVSRLATVTAIDELATALAYWAATWIDLNIARDVVDPDLSLLVALDALPRLAETERGGPIMGLVDRALGLDGMDTTISRAMLPDQVDPAFDEIIQAAGRLFLSNFEHHRVSLIHAVTIPAAARELAPLLAENDRSRFVAHVWEAVAVLAAMFGNGSASSVKVDSPAPIADSVDRAVKDGDAHAIKLAEACVRETAHQPDAADLFAAVCEAGAR